MYTEVSYIQTDPQVYISCICIFCDDHPFLFHVGYLLVMCRDDVPCLLLMSIMIQWSANDPLDKPGRSCNIGTRTLKEPVSVSSMLSKRSAG